MKIISLSNTELVKICNDLGQKVLNTGFQPSLILGVKTGGVRIANLLYETFKDTNCVIDYCHPIRPATLKKKNIFKQNLKILPVYILNLLRFLENIFVFNRKSRHNFISIELPPNISIYKNILIVDDALDSGASMSAVTEAIKTINKHAEIKTAVLTITRKKPIFTPDFTFYPGSTLIRFPWSIDAK